jgi:amidase
MDAVGAGDLPELTIADLQARLVSGMLSSRELAEAYLGRVQAIDRDGPHLRSVLEVNPDALDLARELDEERRRTGPRGPLHGIRVMLKDNIDTHDRMHTTAGSLALLESTPRADATVAARLRGAGAVLLGKLNLSEWANFRSSASSSGWSGRGGQCLKPYALDRSPCGSSSGSAVAVSANLCAAALGTETDGSTLCPAGVNGVAAIKPTLGLTSRAGVIPVSHNQDTIGPFGRTVADAAAVLGALVGVDPRDPATSAGVGRLSTDYTGTWTRRACGGRASAPSGRCSPASRTRLRWSTRRPSRRCAGPGRWWSIRQTSPRRGGWRTRPRSSR